MEMIANFAGGGLCLLIGALMLRFKLVNLVAGYNTASSKEKEKYDKNRLANYTGILMISIGTVLVLGGLLYLLLRQWLVLSISWGLFAAMTLGAIIYINVSKCCYKDEYR